MKKSRKIVVGIVLVVVVALMGGLAAKKKMSTGKKGPNVSIAHPQSEELIEFISAPGEVDPTDKVQFSAQGPAPDGLRTAVYGHLKELRAKEAGPFRVKGQQPAIEVVGAFLARAQGEVAVGQRSKLLGPGKDPLSALRCHRFSLYSQCSWI